MNGRRFDWGGFAVRFVVGGVLGVFVAFGVLSARLYLWDVELYWFMFVSIVLTCAVCSGYFGEGFWQWGDRP